MIGASNEERKEWRVATRTQRRLYMLTALVAVVDVVIAVVSYEKLA